MTGAIRVTVYAVKIGWRVPHVFEEVFEIGPSVTNCDAFCSIHVIFYVIGVIASLEYTLPYVVGSSIRLSVFDWHKVISLNGDRSIP
jgi:hypothetical protein